jgi:chromosome segregation ATPase
MLVVAGVVVYANRIPNLQDSVNELNNAKQSAELRANAAEQGRESDHAASAASIQQLQSQLDQQKQANLQLQANISDLSAQKAQNAQQYALQSADVLRLTEALQASEVTKNRYSQQIAELRQSNDDKLTQNAQLNTTVTDLSNKLDVTERERQFLSEQLTEAKGRLDKQSALLMDNNIADTSAPAGLQAGAPPISGVIRDFRRIHDIPYATVSVGANESVVKGMEFNLVDDSGHFLGKLTIDSVEQDEATGRVAGPNVDLIRPGVIAKTQL